MVEKPVKILDVTHQTKDHTAAKPQPLPHPAGTGLSTTLKFNFNVRSTLATKRRNNVDTMFVYST